MCLVDLALHTLSIDQSEVAYPDLLSLYVKEE